MPNKKTHEENMVSLCILCGGRAIHPGDRLLSQTEKELIHKFVFDSFLEFSDVLPKSMCGGCRRRLHSQLEPKPRPLPPRMAYEKMVQYLYNLPKQTRQNPDCTCEFCLNCSSHHRKKDFSAPPSFSSEVPNTQPGKPSKVDEPSVSKMPICPNCYGEIGRGKAHLCNKSQKVENAENLITPATREKLAAKLIKEKAKAKETSSPICLSSCLLNELKLKSISFYLATDLKLTNIIAGIQSHASSFPCTWCQGCAPWIEPGLPRTLGNIRKYAKEYAKTGKKHFNCIHLPLLEGDDDTEILDCIPPPELHLLLGGVNKIVDVCDKKAGNNLLYKWLERHNICKKNYRGGVLEGNQCREVLRKAQLLTKDMPTDLKKYGQALQDFNLVVEGCFGKSLTPDFYDRINRFGQSFKQLDIQMTPKIHAILHHVPQFCERHGQGLGNFSEQASEAVHSDFKKTWDRFKVDENRQSYSQQLLQAVVNYNGFHI